MALNPQFAWLLSIAWRRRWVPLAVLVVVSAVAVYLYRREPKVYSCTFHVQFDPTLLSGRLALLADALGLGQNEDLQTQMFVVKSLEVAKKAVERLPPDADPYALAQRIMASTSAKRLGDSFIFEAEVKWDSPDRCLDVARAVLEGYREYDVTSRTERDAKTKELLGQYAEKLRDDIAHARARMTDASKLDEIDKEMEARRAESSAAAAEIVEQSRKWTAERDEAVRTYKETWPGLRDLTARIDALAKVASATAAQLDDAVREMAANAALSAAIAPFVQSRRRSLAADQALAEAQARRDKLAASLQEKTGSALTQRELSRLLEQYEALQANLETERRNLDLNKLRVSNRFTVLKEPTFPAAPTSPDARTFVYAGVLAFLVLSGAGLYAAESLDPSMRTVEDIQHHAKADVLGVIPCHTTGKASAEGIGDLTFDPKERHGASDAYRILRVNLLAALDQAPPGKARILLTSSEPQEGKSTTVSNLACAFAESGAKTLLLSCNLRRPTIEKVFGIQREPGLVEVLSGKATWSEAVVQAVFPSLHVLPTGKIGPDSFVLLNSPTLSSVLDAVSEEYDVVLIDSPPTLLASDALLLAPRVDGVAVVYSVQETSKRSLLRTVELIERSKAKLLGIVANHKTVGAHGGYYAYYHYNYSAQTAEAGCPPEAGRS